MLSYPKSRPPSVETVAAIMRGTRECLLIAWAFRLFVSTSSGLQIRTVSLRRFNDRSRREHETERVRHSRMPGSFTGHLRGVVGNDHAVEVVAVKNREDADHIHITLVDEGFAIVRHFPHDVAEMNVRDLALFAVLVYRVVNVAVRHLS